MSVFRGLGTNKAAKQQARAANNAATLQAQGQERARLDLERGRTNALQELNFGFQNARSQLMPLVDAGDRYRAAYDSELGLGERPEGYSGFQSTPGYAFQRDEGLRSVENALAARGQFNSGALQKAKMRYATGLADQEYGNHLSRLAGLAQTGVNSRGALVNLQSGLGRDRANIFTNQAAQSANTRIGEGNALAEGAIRAGNARAQGTQALFNIPGDVLNENLQVAGTAADIFGKVAGGASSFVF